MVVHVHSVNTVAWAVRRDGAARLSEKLAGLAWSWVPYVSSGRPLALQLEQAMAIHPETSIFVLGNHGLVIGAESCDAALKLLDEVETRVASEPRPAPAADLALLNRMANASEWRLPVNTMLHALGTDPVSSAILAGGILYPCQALFAAHDAGSSPPVRIPYRVVEDGGVMVRRPDVTRTEMAALTGLVDVIQRIEPTAPLRYLTAAEVALLMSEEALAYRAMVEGNECVTRPLTAKL